MSDPEKKVDNRMIVQLTVAELRELIRQEVKASGNGREPDRLLDAEEAAKLLAVSKGWFYKHYLQLPFTIKVHHKMLRFSSAGIQQYIAAKKAKGGC